MKKILVLMLMVSPFFGCAQVQAKIPNLQTVSYVDVDLYLGKWYEIAHFYQRFQKGCTATTAQYSRRPDGEIEVVNSCHLDSPQGKLKQGIARAWIVDKKTNAKLKVQFFLTRFKLPLFAGNYWILDLGEEGNEPYSHAIVGDNSGKYICILARKPKLSEQKYNDLVAKAKALGFDTTKLIKTIH